MRHVLQDNLSIRMIMVPVQCEVLYQKYFAILLGKEGVKRIGCDFGVNAFRFLFRAMAEAPRSLELLLSCQVCFEDFEEDGHHIPRLLPCTHTLCHTCVGQLIQENKIECPECREKHEAENKEKSFPQNKYILTQIKRKSSKEQSTAHEFQKCVDH